MLNFFATSQHADKIVWCILAAAILVVGSLEVPS